MIISRLTANMWIRSLGTLVALLFVIIAATGAEARNVPGSVSAVQPRIDRAVAFSLLDIAQVGARDAATFETCQQFLSTREQTDGGLRHPCRWGISFGGGVRYIEGSPDGYDFDFTSAFGSATVAFAVSPSTTFIASLIGESGDGDLDYNDGRLENVGLGALIGLIIRLDSAVDFSLIGGAEWLNYETDRTNGLFESEYDAVRYLLDAQLKARHDDDYLFIEYGGGLRLVHQDNESYRESSGGATFANVPSSGFTILTGIGDLKLGTELDGIRPYLQGTGYVNLIDNSDLAADLDNISPGDETLSGRFGFGLDTDFAGGALTFTIGVFVGEEGFQGADGGIRFVKAF